MSSEKTPGVAPLTIEAIATRAYQEGLNADQMFEQHEDPAENHVRPEDFENPELRSKVDVLLCTVVDFFEIEKYMDELADSQYEGSLDTLKTFGLYDPEQPKEGDVPAPTLEQAKEILANQVTPEQLKVIKGMEKPVLQLIPVAPMKRYVKALNSYRPMDKQENAYVSLSLRRGGFEQADERDGVSGNESITGWKIAVTEGAKEPKLLEGDDVNKTLGERAAWFKQKFERKGVSGVDLKRMLVLTMDSLKNGEPINDFWNNDVGTWTFVNGEAEENSTISGVYWDSTIPQVSLRGRGVDLPDSYVRFRPSVIVDVPR